MVSLANAAEPDEGARHAAEPNLTALELVDDSARLALPIAGEAEAASEVSIHRLFRYPAKFHPPVVQALLERYTQPDDVVYDPFVGCGTLLVEAALGGRHAIGVDVDPVAVFISRAKTRAYDPARVRRACRTLAERLDQHDRGGAAYKRLQFEDISERTLRRVARSEELFVPQIPRLDHWFRRYVVVDLGRIEREIRLLRVDADTRLLLRMLFASIIRNASNADPVPVSGLEVTSHMRKRDEDGRIVDPFALMRRALRRGADAAIEWAELLPDCAIPRAVRADATTRVSMIPRQVDAVITSPPYHNAVDYYRRHQLEMFWLGFTVSQEDRLSLLPHYIGRPRIPARHPLLASGVALAGLAQSWETQIAARDEGRARDFKHYMLSMRAVMDRLAERTACGAPVVFVVGQSAWNGGQIPTVALFKELAAPHFEVLESLWYPVINRYMSYERRNGASIDREHVVALQRTTAPA